MDNDNHTEKDWKIAVSTDADGDLTNDIKCGCDTIASNVPSDADAFLIKEAPQLLKAARRYVKNQKTLHAEMGRKPTHTSYWILKEILDRIDNVNKGEQRMKSELQLAKAKLKAIGPLDFPATFRGIPVSEFDKDEVVKIAGLFAKKWNEAVGITNDMLSRCYECP